MAKKWIQGAIKHPGALKRKASTRGMTVGKFEKTVKDNPDKYSIQTKRQVNLARTLGSFRH